MEFVSLVARATGGAGLLFAGISYFEQQVEVQNFMRGGGLILAGIAFLVLALSAGLQDVKR